MQQKAAADKAENALMVEFQVSYTLSVLEVVSTILKSTFRLLHWPDIIFTGTFDLRYISACKLPCCVVVIQHSPLPLHVTSIGPCDVQEHLSADKDLMSVAMKSLWDGRPGPLYLSLNSRMVAERKVILLYLHCCSVSLPK